MYDFTKIPRKVGAKTVGAIRKMKAAAPKALSTAGNVATGAAIVSMIPMTANASTEKDIDRMKQYQPAR
jgi:uncharacterized protein YegL